MTGGAECAVAVAVALDGVVLAGAPGALVPAGAVATAGVTAGARSVADGDCHQVDLRARCDDVRFGSEADLCVAKPHVRFTPNSDREKVCQRSQN